MFDLPPLTLAPPRPGPITQLLTGSAPSATERELTVRLAMAMHWAREARRASAPDDAHRLGGPSAVPPRSPAAGLAGVPDWADAHPLAVELEAGLPGPELAARLSALDAGSMDDAALVEAAAGWERMAAWAIARQAEVVNELRHRREGAGRGDFTGDELAARLATTRAAAAGKVGDAVALELLPQVWDALAAGRIDPRKARVLCDELLALPESAREAVSEAVLAQADSRTAEQLRSRIRRAALALDPDAARQAHDRARRDRHVELHPVRDGMAWIHAFLPAPDAVAVHTALTALADAQGPDDPRPMDARRADALVDVVTRWLDAGTTPDGTPLPSRQRRRPHLAVTASARTLLGLDSEPCELAGYGPISAEMAREIAAASTWTPLLLDAATGALTARGHRTYRPSGAQADWIVDRDLSCTFPGCRVPAVRCDIDHNTPFDHTRPADHQTVVDAMDAKCRHHHRMKTHGGWRTVRDPETGTTVWTSPTGHTYARPPERPMHHGGDPPSGGGRAAQAEEHGRRDGPEDSGASGPAPDAPPF